LLSRDLLSDFGFGFGFEFGFGFGFGFGCWSQRWMKHSLFVGAMGGSGGYMSETPMLIVSDMEGRSPPRGSFLGLSRGTRVLEIGSLFWGMGWGKILEV
jgi:hypothetical protein